MNNKVLQARPKVVSKLGELAMSLDGGKQRRNKLTASDKFLEQRIMSLCNKREVRVTDHVECLGVDVRNQIKKMVNKGRGQRETCAQRTGNVKKKIPWNSCKCACASALFLEPKCSGAKMNLRLTTTDCVTK